MNMDSLRESGGSSWRRRGLPHLCIHMGIILWHTLSQVSENRDARLSFPGTDPRLCPPPPHLGLQGRPAPPWAAGEVRPSQVLLCACAEHTLPCLGEEPSLAPTGNFFRLRCPCDSHLTCIQSLPTSYSFGFKSTRFSTQIYLFIEETGGGHLGNDTGGSPLDPVFPRQ